MIGLALAGGGVKGSYQIGAYMAFKKCHIKFNGICGTSIGAFNAAMLSAKMDRELLKFWQNADIGKILEFDEKYVKKVNEEKFSLDLLKATFDNFSKILKNKGISTEGLKEVLNSFDLESKIRNSNVDFGITTYRLKDLKPLQIFKNEMKSGSINNYILASCYLPVFKMEKLEDDSFYFDGGIYDNCPANMLLKKKYDKVYRVELKSMGYHRKLIDESKVITISPSHKLSDMLSVNKKEINNNILYGYYDTLKVLKKYDGNKYIFSKLPNFVYKLIIKNIDLKTLEKEKILLNVKSDKEFVIKVVEDIMQKNKETYFKVYNIVSLIKKYKKNAKGYGTEKIIKSFFVI